MREREVREIQAALLDGSSVRLVAPRETGRTFLLEQVATAMEARGFTAFRVTGRRAFRDQPYVALREAGLVSLRGAQSESDIADELAAELDAATRPLILVDDAEHLDLESAYLIEYSRARRNIPTVLSAPPFVMLDAQGRAATNKIRTQARYELAPLGYAQISLLAQRVLGAPAQPEVLSQVLAMSSGLTGIAAAILRTAAQEGKIVRQESGWALDADSLWNVHLRSTVEQLIFGLQRDEFRALHALALAESVVVERFHAIASAPLIGLTQHGLITTFADAAGVAQVAPRPSLITDYFQHQPIDPLHYEALHLLCELGDAEAQERATLGAAATLARAETFDRAHNRGTGIARFQRATGDTALAKATRDWRSDPSAEHAVIYLDHLITTESYLPAAAAVFERTRGGGSTPMAIRLGMHRLFWDTQANREGAKERLRAAVAAEPDPVARVAFEAFEAYLVFSRRGMEPDVGLVAADGTVDRRLHARDPPLHRGRYRSYS
ncbi:ATP-binding protein [Leucobacter chromiireducens]|uniref:ATP-binding protein n=1 Tax=Leucobacter chromiireducens TaxID=283877 RepID=UPI000F6302CF|nr:ATP-binding protein [Leucobacter chromiireducens]